MFNFYSKFLSSIRNSDIIYLAKILAKRIEKQLAFNFCPQNTLFWIVQIFVLFKSFNQVSKILKTFQTSESTHEVFIQKLCNTRYMDIQESFYRHKKKHIMYVTCIFVHPIMKQNVKTNLYLFGFNQLRNQTCCRKNYKSPRATLSRDLSAFLRQRSVFNSQINT